MNRGGTLSNGIEMDRQGFQFGGRTIAGSHPFRVALSGVCLGASLLMSAGTGSVFAKDCPAQDQARSALTTENPQPAPQKESERPKDPVSTTPPVPAKPEAKSSQKPKETGSRTENPPRGEPSGSAKTTPPAQAGKKKLDATAGSRRLATGSIKESQEQQALTLAREQHPELAELLVRLKETDQKQYERAILELARDAERLERLKQKTPDRHAIELRRWKIESRIRLLAARLTMSSTPELQSELRSAIAERLDVQAELLKSERDRLQQRLKEIDQSLDKVESKRPESTEQELQKILQQAGIVRAAAKKQSKAKSGTTRNSVAGKSSETKPAATKAPEAESQDTKSGDEKSDKAASKQPGEPGLNASKEEETSAAAEDRSAVESGPK